MRILFLLFFLLLAAPASAGTIVFGITDYPPYTYMHNGTADGLAVRYTNAVAEHLGQTPEYKLMPTSRAINNLQQGVVDAVFPFYKTTDRAAQMYFCPDPIISENVILSTMDTTRLGWHGDFAALDSVGIGVVIGYSYGPRFDFVLGNQGFTKIVYFYNTEEALAALIKGNIAVVPGSEEVLKAITQKHFPTEKFAFLRPVLGKVDSYIAFSSLDTLPITMKQWNKAFATMQTNGTFAAISDQFYKEYYASGN